MKPAARQEQTEVRMRPPEQVMRLARMGTFFPTRLSFMRTLIRRLASGKAWVERPIWQIDGNGYGRAVYSAFIDGNVYSLAAFSAPLDAKRRTDRVIAEAWDTTYVLYDGAPNPGELSRIEANASRQEEGRYLPTDLVLSRANKSVRLFEHVADCLAEGRQPGDDLVNSVGYLMRTTAVYANGKFGVADRDRLLDRPGMEVPFQAELLTVWLIRGFTHDLVEHVAANRGGGRFVPLERRLKRHLGIGNSTGLGMAPFLVNHPMLIHCWMNVRETALARVRCLPGLDGNAERELQRLTARAKLQLEQWNVDDERQMERIRRLRAEFAEMADFLEAELSGRPYPLDRLVRRAERLSHECQELVVALVLEPFGSLVDHLAERMSSSGLLMVDASMRIGQLKELVHEHYSWALKTDFLLPEETARFWYVSEEKLEPRLGNRRKERGAKLELPLDIARRIQRLVHDLAKAAAAERVAEFLARFPAHRYIVRRVQATPRHPYSEVQDNLLGEKCLPIDLLRCKLSFFGASKFDPKSDRWTRIAMYQGAPLFDELEHPDADDWWLSALEPPP